MGSLSKHSAYVGKIELINTLFNVLLPLSSSTRDGFHGVIKHLRETVPSLLL